MAASDYLELALLNHIFEGSAYTQPTVWVGLSTADPGDDGTGLAEPAGGAYARVRPTDNTGRWDIDQTAGVTTASNKGEITFPEATAGWGTVTHVVLFDAEAAGNILASVALDAAREILSGDTAKFEIGQLTIQLD